ncbi:hypothetical protein Pla110_14840 [Polystyrenella longa]|uniref:Uncharacterized protein n=1 Tax=Polystyrenella longa TaxID=2528007 RepID=A0A518CKL5_9PLAN|nr:hypothetical protein [Polystyrenella longa]QDU79770.1 hypothetical protein Pla110_14840 [Polystyrenella longa]
MSDSIGVMDEVEDFDNNSLELEEGLEFEEDVQEIDFNSLGIDPLIPTEAKPGSEEKVLMLAARYSAGLPLWHNSDCYDHGPGGVDDEELEEMY